MSGFIGSKFKGDILITEKTIDRWMNQYSCPNDPTKLKFQGKDTDPILRIPGVIVTACKGKKFCKSDEEIEQFLTDKSFTILFRS